MRQGPVPNGGASLKPIWFVVAVPIIFTIVIFPPAGAVLTLVVGSAILVKAHSAHRERRRSATHRARMAEYYTSRQQRILSENWTNPGWRV